MQLLERTECLEVLKRAFHQTRAGRGQNVFVVGEAGIGKTAVVRQFLSDLDSPYLLMEGYCDSLFAARPLGPLFDIAPLLGEQFVQLLRENPNRVMIFPALLEALGDQTRPVILWFEDIHWADEATLDLIRFLARRIHQTQCLFILSLRDTELPGTHPYRQLLGELNPEDVFKIMLSPLSRETVNALADSAGRNGEEVYHLTAGVPYYVREILSSYHLNIPETVRDSILALYHRQSEATRELWETISVIPGRIDLDILHKIYPTFSRMIDFCFAARILIHEGNSISFKHELFRTAIEESLSPVRRRELHQAVVEAMLASPGAEVPVARIIHHARLGGDTVRLRTLAPSAAEEAALLGSHQEAAKFYKVALDHSNGLDPAHLAELFERYAFECYLTNQIPEAIQALEKALDTWGSDEYLKRGNTLRALSRLHWLAGQVDRAEAFGLEAIDLCEKASPAHELAMAYNNMSQLMLLKGMTSACIEWGNRAIAIAEPLDDQEAICHGCGTVGAALVSIPDRVDEGEAMQHRSLGIALKNQYHEHAARAYTNLGISYLELHRFAEAEQILEEGIHYCDERDLEAWFGYLQNALVHVYLHTGRWTEAQELADRLLLSPALQVHVWISLMAVRFAIRMRSGDEVELEELMSVVRKAWQIGELQRIGSVVKVLLEYEWLNESTHPFDSFVTGCITKLISAQNATPGAELKYWLWKSKGQLPEEFAGNASLDEGDRKQEVMHALEQIRIGNPYLDALALAEGGEDDQREALLRLRELGALASAKRLEGMMRQHGIQHIPRGPRSSTTENTAGLTRRQMDVLALLAKGLQNKEIAAELFISAKTIDHHISAILAKLDVPSRTMAVAKARELGMLK